MENVQLQRYSRHVYYDADEQEYVALCSEFPHLSAYGETPAEALEELDVAIEGAIEVHRDEGWPIPEPVAPPEPEGLPSGKFVVRLPKTLHAQLAKRAKHEGTSLNTLVITLLALGAVVPRTEELVTELVRAQGREVKAAVPYGHVPGSGMQTTVHVARTTILGAWVGEEDAEGDAAWGDTHEGAWILREPAENKQETMVN